MNHQLLIVVGLLGVCVALFVANRPRMDVVALLALVALSLSGIVTIPEALAGFSDPNVILIAALFVVGEGLVATGVANQIGDFLLNRSGGSETRLILWLMLSAAILGSVMSSTGVVAIFIPVVLMVAARRKLSPGRLMMPLAYAGLISGMLTLVGTAPNLVVDSALRHAGHEGFGFFTFTPFGAVILVAGISYLLVARRWLNRNGDSAESARPRRQLIDFVRGYRLETREARLRVGKNSPLIGKTLEEVGTRRRFAANVVAIERRKGDHPEVLEPRSDFRIQAGDILLIDLAEPTGGKHLADLEEFQLEPMPLLGRYFTDRSRDIGMAEVLLPPDSDLVGRTIVEAAFRTRFRLNVIGLRRGREAIEGALGDEKLRTGDTLLVIGRWKHIRNLQKRSRDFIVLTLPAEIDEVAPAASRAPWALASLALMVVLMVTGWVPNVIAALTACLLMGAARCLTLDAAYRAIQWPSLILIIGMIPFSTALQKTGGVDLAVEGLLHVFGGAGPRVLLAALFALTAVIGLFVSNTATAVLMAPIALSAAHAMGSSPYPFAMTVALASSAAFMTPVSSPVNTLVMVPGKYQFSDFVRVGVPFTAVVMLLTVVMVPWLLPL